VRGPSFTGLGNRPVLTPAHQVDFETGIGPSGARIDVSRTKPVLGSVACCIMMRLHPVGDGGGLGGVARPVSEFGFPVPVFGYLEPEFGFFLNRSRQSPGNISAPAFK
jgi:hypothetical protein